MRILVIIILFVIAGCSLREPTVKDARKLYKEGDYMNSVSLLKKLSANGDAEAQFDLGNLHVLGEHIPEDQQKAEEYWEQSCLGGFAMACGNLGQRLLGYKKYSKAETILLNGAKGGDTASIKHLVKLYSLESWSGADQKKAEFWKKYEK